MLVLVLLLFLSALLLLLALVLLLFLSTLFLLLALILLLFLSLLLLLLVLVLLLFTLVLLLLFRLCFVLLLRRLGFFLLCAKGATLPRRSRTPVLIHATLFMILLSITAISCSVADDVGRRCDSDSASDLFRAPNTSRTTPPANDQPTKYWWEGNVLMTLLGDMHRSHIHNSLFAGVVDPLIGEDQRTCNDYKIPSQLAAFMFALPPSNDSSPLNDA